MERIEGKPLIEVLRNNEHDEELLINVGKAIRELHRNAVNHGDLSTNNILIDKNRNPVLIDLGLSSREYDLEGFGIDLHLWNLDATRVDVGVVAESSQSRSRSRLG